MGSRVQETTKTLRGKSILRQPITGHVRPAATALHRCQPLTEQLRAAPAICPYSRRASSCVTESLHHLADTFDALWERTHRFTGLEGTIATSLPIHVQEAELLRRGQTNPRTHGYVSNESSNTLLCITIPVALYVPFNGPQVCSRSFTFSLELLTPNVHKHCARHSSASRT